MNQTIEAVLHKSSMFKRSSKSVLTNKSEISINHRPSTNLKLSSKEVQIPQWVQCTKCRKWRVVMIDYGQTLKLSPSWTCTQNTQSSSYDSCQAPQEIPNVEKYSQAQLTALCRHRDLYSRKKSGKSGSLKTGKETSSKKYRIPENP